ncbi:MAG: hypothetical protein F6J87_12020 [Spirulina sp. SIO3F2]|nr:hypothetical protein [Spirulina sp. SIO3F2]
MEHPNGWRKKSSGRHTLLIFLTLDTHRTPALIWAILITNLILLLRPSLTPPKCIAGYLLLWLLAVSISRFFIVGGDATTSWTIAIHQIEVQWRYCRWGVTEIETAPFMLAATA